jgi:hypothetical protein
VAQTASVPSSVCTCSEVALFPQCQTRLKQASLHQQLAPSGPSMQLASQLGERPDGHPAQVEADLQELVREVVAGRPSPRGASTRDDRRRQELAATGI